MAKKRVRLILGLSAVLLAAGAGVVYRSVQKYIDTHTWATISVMTSLETDVSEVTVDEVEVLQGDVFSLHQTEVTVLDVAHDGTVKLAFSPEVTDTASGEEIDNAVLTTASSCSLKEHCINGDSSSVRLCVVSHRYQ